MFCVTHSANERVPASARDTVLSVNYQSAAYYVETMLESNVQTVVYYRKKTEHTSSHTVKQKNNIILAACQLWAAIHDVNSCIRPSVCPSTD